jgi:hypothetical protein
MVSQQRAWWGRVVLFGVGMLALTGRSDLWAQGAEWTQNELCFVENRGQWRTSDLFVARRGALIARLERSAIALGVRQGSTTMPQLRLSFEDAAPHARVAGAVRAEGTRNFFLGEDPARWFRDVPAFAQVVYQDLYPGVDVVVRNQQSCALAYDLLLSPDADLSRVIVVCEGTDGLIARPDGSLELRTPFGPLVQSAPCAWLEEPGGTRRKITCRPVVLDDHRFGFQVEGEREGLPLVVDPGLEYSSYLGGDLADQGAAITFAKDAVYVAGHSMGVEDSSADVVVAKLKNGGHELAYWTTIGGSDHDEAFGIAVDDKGNAYVTGSTSSPDFPTTSDAVDRTQNGTFDAFVIQLDPSGADLKYATFLGSPGEEDGWDIAVKDGVMFVAGRTNSPDFPRTAGAHVGSFDVFLTRIKRDKGILSSFVFGGARRDEAHALALGGDGSIYLHGVARSTDFPITPGAFDSTQNGAYDSFVAKVRPSGDQLVYSTYLGGTGQDVGYDIAVDSSGAAFVTGITSSPDLPVTEGSFGPVWHGYTDAYVVKLSPDGSQVLLGGYLGGAEDDYGYAISVDQTGGIVVAGTSRSPDFPVTLNAGELVPRGGLDAFVARIDATGDALAYAGLLGGSADDEGYDLALDGHGSVYVTGVTRSPDFTVTEDALDASLGGTRDAFLTRIDFACKAAWSNFGSGWSGTAGVPAFTSSAAPVLCTDIQLKLARSAPSPAGAVMFLGLASAELHTDWGGRLLVLPSVEVPVFLEHATQSYSVSVPCEPFFCGLTFYVQALELDPGASKGVSFTRGLQLLVGGS